MYGRFQAKNKTCNRHGLISDFTETSREQQKPISSVCSVCLFLCRNERSSFCWECDNPFFLFFYYNYFFNKDGLVCCLEKKLGSSIICSLPFANFGCSCAILHLFVVLLYHFKVAVVFFFFFFREFYFPQTCTRSHYMTTKTTENPECMPCKGNIAKAAGDFFAASFASLRIFFHGINSIQGSR